VLSQDEPKAWVWARATTEFAPPLAEIYAGIETG
jgi:hypothetical protein